MQSNPKPAPKGTALRETASLILRSIAVAMGAAVAVLAVMRALDVQSGFILLGIGLACLAHKIPAESFLLPELHPIC